MRGGPLRVPIRVSLECAQFANFPGIWQERRTGVAKIVIEVLREAAKLVVETGAQKSRLGAA